MISAPIIPRTRESLWDLLETEPERIERGFALVQRDLVVGDGIVVDALGRDSAGRLALVFLACEEDDKILEHRVFFANQWVTRNERLLLSALPEAGVRGGSLPRIVVLGFEFGESTVHALRAMPLDDLAMLRCEVFVLDGHLHAGLSPIDGVRAGEHDTMAVPPGVADGELRRVGEEIVDLLNKLDPNLEVEGDRYSRRFHSAHGLLAELFMVGDRLYFVGAGDAAPRPVSGADSRDIADSIVRTYLDQLSRPATAKPRRDALRATLAEAPGQPRRKPVREPGSESLRIDHSLHPLPRTPLIDDTEVSQEEFDAFSGLSSESKGI